MKKANRFFTATLASVISLCALATPCFAAKTTVSSAEITDYLPAIIGGCAALAIAGFVAFKVVSTKKRKAAEKRAELINGNKTQDASAITDDPTLEDETVAEETVVESKPVEEPAKEEVVETKEEPAVEVKAEPIVEDTPVVDEAPAVEETVAKETIATADSELAPGQFRDPETGCIYTLDENGIPVPPEGMIVRYKWSFLARLIQADNVVKYRYMMLRRLLLSYKKVRSNVSWNFDSYFLGRKTIAKIKIRGKHVVIYFNVSPESMAGSKYVGEDVSKIARYKSVPFAYRINGERKLQYAMELIAQLLEGTDSTEPDYIAAGQERYAIPSSDFNTLFADGYIKINSFLAVDRVATASDDDDDDDTSPIDDEADNEELEVEADITPIEPENFNFTPPKK